MLYKCYRSHMLRNFDVIGSVMYLVSDLGENP